MTTQLSAYRSHLVAQLIFLDQLCEISPYLPRSTLESHVPYAILRSIYSQYYSTTPSTPHGMLLNASPRNSPALSLGHGSPAVRQPRGPGGDSTPQHSGGNDSGFFRGHGQDYSHEGDIGGLKGVDHRQRNSRRSGPLDYSSTRKVKFSEGSASGSSIPSPLPRFAVSRSGPLAYK